MGHYSYIIFLFLSLEMLYTLFGLPSDCFNSDWPRWRAVPYNFLYYLFVTEQGLFQDLENIQNSEATL